MKRGPMICAGICAAVVLLTIASGHAQTASSISSTLQQEIQMSFALMGILPQPLIDPTTDPPGNFTNVIPKEFDPGHTNLTQSSWLSGTGCPSGATTATPNTDFTGIAGFGTYSDTACMGNSDPNDQKVQGLLLVKTGPTETNFASATAELINVKGIPALTELGYDIRKAGADHSSPLGSHCGAGAPRFNITTSEAFYFIGCASPPPTTESPGQGWIRLRWSAPMGYCLQTHGPSAACPANFDLVPVLGTVQRIVIVFDEAQDSFGTPDMFGAAMLDNIDVNGMLVGRGPVTAN